MLLSRRADVRGVLLSRLYMMPEKNRFRFFSRLQTDANAKSQDKAARRLLDRPAAFFRRPRWLWLWRAAHVAPGVPTRATDEPKQPQQKPAALQTTYALGTIVDHEKADITSALEADARFVREHLADFLEDLVDPRIAPAARGDAGAKAAAPGAHHVSFRTGCRIEDVFYWALLVGNAELADVLWRKSKAHLRLALLAAEVYRKTSESDQGRKHREEIEPLQECWTGVACELLDHARPTEKLSGFEVAETILTWPSWNGPALAAGTPTPASLETENSLDLATRLKAKKVIAHHHCQLIMTRRWTGHPVELAGDPPLELRLVDDAAPNFKVIVKAFIPWHPVLERLLKFAGLNEGWWPARVEPNPKRAAKAATDAPARASHRSRASGQDESDDFWPAWYHVYEIPAVKFWVRTILSHGGVALLNCALVLGTSITQPNGLAARPGPTQAALEVLFAVWILGLAVDWLEVRPKRLEWRTSKLRPAWIFIDGVSLFWQALVVGLRVVYVAGCARASAQEARGEAAALFPGGFGRYRDVATDWLFPIAMALSSLTCFGRFLIETPLVFMRLGVLAISTREMLLKNVVQWGCMMAVVLTAFGLAFVALVPEYVVTRLRAPRAAAARRAPIFPPARLSPTRPPRRPPSVRPRYGRAQTDCYVADVDTAQLSALDGLPACASRFATGPWFISVWALFGDINIGALEDARSLLPALLLVVLLIIAQVLLLNLLIAMMNDTYQDINRRAAVEYVPRARP